MGGNFFLHPLRDLPFSTPFHLRPFATAVTAIFSRRRRKFLFFTDTAADDAADGRRG